MDVLERVAALVPTCADRPSVVGITGAVAAGKSTSAARLAEALAPRAATVVSTDGFLMTNAELVEHGTFPRKGEPDTYDVEALADFVRDVRAGTRATAPVYSHLVYDRVAEESLVVESVDVLVLEGLHLLHDRFAPVREILDLSVFLDAADVDLEVWYVERLRNLVAEARSTPGAFEFFRSLEPRDCDEVARMIWTSVNAPNNARFVRPTRDRADVVIDHGPDHSAVAMAVRE